jgi:hypothetical protein
MGTPPQKGKNMGNTEQAPSKRVRIVLCAAVLAVAAIVPGAGLAADWSSGITPTAEWSSAEWSSALAPTAEWSSGKRAPKAEWSSGKRAPKAEWSSGKRAPKAEWSSRYRASALR